ncbi:DUF4349 domain-containing protein [Georgenia sp. Z1491]|uniref:DUF4349 domain-containing protein n=1 Tax=Georgenia sp. Z1491 TaxID=3416707 RepID=UPI003CF1AFD9
MRTSSADTAPPGTDGPPPGDVGTAPAHSTAGRATGRRSAARPAHRPTGRRALAALTLGLAATLAACSSGSDGGGYDEDAGTADRAPAQEADQGADSAASAEQSAADTSGDPAQVTADGVDRVVVTTGEATVVVEDPVAATDEVVGLVETHEGRVEGRQLSSQEDRPWGQVVVRVAPDRTDAFLADLGEIGEVEQVSTNADDVTGTVRDLDAEISALETSVARLEGLMEEAGSVADLLSAETELTARQAELDQLRGQRTNLGEQAAMSTLTVDLVTEDSPSTTGSQSGWSRMWEDAGEAFTGAIRGVVVAVAALAPLLVVLALVGAVVLTVVRRNRRARDAETVTHGAAPARTTAGAGTTSRPEGPSGPRDPRPAARGEAVDDPPSGD